MLNSQVFQEIFGELYVYRMHAVLSARYAVETNNRTEYLNDEGKYEFAERLISHYFRETDEAIESEYKEFPEWPVPSMRPVFSDEEINSWPVVFSDGSVVEVDDVADMPF